MSDLLTTSEAIEFLGWNRSSLWRAEHDNRISRACTIGRSPRWRREDVDRLRELASAPATDRTSELRELEDTELAEVRRSLVELEAAGEAGLEGTRPLRLMAAAARRRLVLRTIRGDRVASREISELVRLEQQIAGLEALERVRDLTREP